MIRPATHLDIPRLVALGQMMHEESSYRDIAYEPKRVDHFLSDLVDGRSGGVLFVSENDGTVYGSIAAGITELWFSHEKIAFDWALFVHPTKRNGITACRLIAAFISWAKIKGAAQIQIGITSGVHVDATARLYRRLGFRDNGLQFAMEVS